MEGSEDENSFIKGSPKVKTFTVPLILERNNKKSFQLQPKFTIYL